MKTKKEKTFDTVKFFRKVKKLLAEKMEGMNLAEQKEFMRKIREGEIKLSVD